MSLNNTLSSTLTLNTAGGPTSGIGPVVTNIVTASAAIGTLPAGPILVYVTTTPTALPIVAQVSTAVYAIQIDHTGAATAANIVIDMQNTAGQSSKLTLSPGGTFLLFNGTLSVSGAGNSNYTNWRLSVATGTTSAAVTLLYS